ncbi:glycosyltransferase [Arthrobacter rhombi]|uniref:glycosyltransferase n=1 Tax=Arthrobacter rhombi TaxID=71253 RepID=UPI003FD34F05
MARIVIVQPRVNAYRVAFLDGVIKALRTAGHEGVVVTGRLPNARRDAVTAPWHVSRRGFSVSFRRHRLLYSGSLMELLKSDVVVVGLSASWLDPYLAFVLRFLRIKRGSVITWGHVDNYTGFGGKFREIIVDWQLRHSDHVLAYTEKGRDSAIRRGVPLEAASSLNNTVDLKSLQLAVRGAGEADRETANRIKFPNSRKVVRKKTFAYIGSLDESKRIDFLSKALESLWRLDPEIKLLVGGEGAGTALLSDAISRNQVVYLGRVGDAEKAEMATWCTAILMPGRVGLVAAESFVLGLPILTTDFGMHAPEFEYLEPGSDSMVFANDVEEYALGVYKLTLQPQRLRQLRVSALAKAGWPALEDMIDTFASACIGQAERGNNLRS